MFNSFRRPSKSNIFRREDTYMEIIYLFSLLRLREMSPLQVRNKLTISCSNYFIFQFRFLKNSKSMRASNCPSACLTTLFEPQRSSSVERLIEEDLKTRILFGITAESRVGLQIVLGRKSNPGPSEHEAKVPIFLCISVQINISFNRNILARMSHCMFAIYIPPGYKMYNSEGQRIACSYTRLLSEVSYYPRQNLAYIKILYANGSTY